MRRGQFVACLVSLSPGSFTEHHLPTGWGTKEDLPSPISTVASKRSSRHSLAGLLEMLIIYIC